MKEHFERYITNLYEVVPTGVYVWLLCILCIGFVLLLLLYGFVKGIRYSLRLILAEYIVLLLCATMFFRTYNATQEYNLRLFWSYAAMDINSDYLLSENIMNISVFTPVGLLLGASFKNIKWWIVMVIGGAISVIIETLQFFFKRGFAETDDLIHNVLGCMVGFTLYILVKKFIEIINNRRLAV